FQDRENFCEEITAQPSAGLDQIMENTLNSDWIGFSKEGKTNFMYGASWMTSNREVQFLKSMASMNNSKRALEVGLFTGCGALAIAEALPADGVVVSCEWDPFIAKLAREFLDKSEHGKKVDIRQGPANETCRKLGDEGQQFDFIYMDANKDGYVEIYDIIKEKNLLAPNGTIVADNALNYGTAYLDENSAMAKFNRHLLADTSVHRIVLPIRDGVMIIRRNSDVNGAV
ncbi:hypothetical protein FSP39_018417, partial [Pinctada imbricata]